MKQRAEVIALRDGWERNEISSYEIWALVNERYITEAEALWILR
jgi:hypothetical protein